MATYPQTRKIHSIGEPPAGSRGTFDPAETSGVTLKVADAAGIEFGVIVEQVTGGYSNIDSSSTSAVGAVPISTLAKDYQNGKYAQDDACAPMIRGYLHVKIDRDNKPAIGTTVRVSYATGKVGYLTSSATDSKIITGIRVVSVYENVAEVYFSGQASYALS